MPRGEQVARLYRLIQGLRDTSRGLPAATLAERNGWNVRTVYRDLRALQDAGFPIAADGARWKLVDGWREAIPFPLSIGELLALHVARQMLHPLSGSPVVRDFDRFLGRVTGPSRAAPRQGELFRRVRAWLSTPSSLGIDYTAHAALLETLCRACETNRTVRAIYYTETRRELTKRDLDPYHLYFDPRLEALYCFAWCHWRKDIRTFAVHRFRRAVLTDRRFEVPPDFTPQAHLRGAFRIWREGNAVNVRLGVDPDHAGWVSERTWHKSQKTRRRADGGVEMEFTVDGTTEIKRFILHLGAAAEVLDPPWLRKEIAQEHEKAALRGAGAAQESLTLDDRGVGETGDRR